MKYSYKPFFSFYLTISIYPYLLKNEQRKSKNGIIFRKNLLYLQLLAGMSFSRNRGKRVSDKVKTY